MNTSARILTAIACIALTGLASCSETSKRPEPAGEFSSAGLDNFDPKRDAADSQKSGESISDIFARNAEDLANLPENGAVPQSTALSSSRPIPAPQANVSRAVDITQPSSIKTLDDFSDEQPAIAAQEYAAINPTEPIAARNQPASQPRTVETIVDELAAALRRRARNAADPFSIYAALSSLESIKSDAIDAHPTDMTDISPRQIDALEALTNIHRIIREGADSESDTAERIVDAIKNAAENLASWEAVEVKTLKLCSRVEGFGVYDELPGPMLLAGRPHRIIVYAELGHFQTTPGRNDSGVAGYLVEVGQELSLFHEVDGLLAWRMSEQNVRDFSRNRRRDFYMVQMIELPENLTVGKYQLKVTIRDKPADSVAEKTLPIEIVADAKLIRAQGDD